MKFARSSPFKGRTPQGEDELPSALRSAMLVMGAYVLLLWAAQGILHAFRSDSQSTLRDVFVFALVQCVVCLWAVLGVGVYGLRGRRMLCPRAWSWREMGRGACLYVMAAPVIYLAAVANAYIVQYIWHQEARQRIVQQILNESNPAAMAMLVVFGVSIAPITEEILFRGFLQRLMRPLCGRGLAICVVAACFAAAHGDIVVIIPVFVLGLLLGWIYERTQHIGVPIALHALHNALTLGIIFSLGIGP